MPQIYHSRAAKVAPGQQHVFIAIPAGAPHDPALTSFLHETQADLAANDIACDLYILSGHCHVDDARNYLVWEFLKTDCTDFLFIDADVCADESAARKLLGIEHDFVGGLYPYKGDDLEFPVRLLDYDSPPVYDGEGCVEVESIPTGFMRLRRRVLTKLAANATHYRNKETRAAKDDRGIPLLFERSLDAEGERVGGDYAFCRKWLATGGRIYVYPDIHFRHYGAKAFCGNFAIHVAKRRGVETPAFDLAVEGVREGEFVEPHIARLVADYGNNYVAPVDLLASAYWIAREADGDILECGSGLSTLILAIAASRTGQTVWALEHDPAWFLRTRKLLDRYQIKNVRLFYAPLKNHASEQVWYAIPDELPARFAIAFIDGPQQRWERKAVFDLMGHRIARAKVLMDDMANEDHADALKMWAHTWGHTVHEFPGDLRPYAISAPSQRELEHAA